MGYIRIGGNGEKRNTGQIQSVNMELCPPGSPYRGVFGKDLKYKEMANRKSPVIGENGIKASQTELSIMASSAKEIFERSVTRQAVNLKDAESVKHAIIEYFEECEQYGKRPGNMGLYRAIGLTRQEVNHIASGRDKNKVSPDVWDIIKTACLILSEYREQLGANNKIHPATLIFWQKNYDSLTDVQTLEVVPNQGQQAEQTPEQIKKAIEADIPIDADAIEL